MRFAASQWSALCAREAALTSLMLIEETAMPAVAPALELLSRRYYDLRRAVAK
jgi:NADPH-dependent ferric siderophore reductase